MLEEEYEFDYDDLERLKKETKNRHGNSISNKLAILKNVEAMRNNRKSSNRNSDLIAYLTIILAGIGLMQVVSSLYSIEILNADGFKLTILLSGGIILAGLVPLAILTIKNLIK